MQSAELVCAVVACGRRLARGETYYLLSGSVATCEACACRARYTIVVSGRERVLERGWDRTACARSLRRVVL